MLSCEAHFRIDISIYNINITIIKLRKVEQSNIEKHGNRNNVIVPMASNSALVAYCSVERQGMGGRGDTEGLRLCNIAVNFHPKHHLCISGSGGDPGDYIRPLTTQGLFE